MTNDLKMKWIQALRSGEYKQGTGYLRCYDRYCCLGVLCDVVGRKWELRANGTYTTDEDELTVPNQDILTLFHSNDDNVVDALIYKNDERRLNFNEIADYIEKVVKVTDEQ